MIETTTAPARDPAALVPEKGLTGGGESCTVKFKSNEEAKCCKECSLRDDEEEAREKMTFEDFLHNMVYIKRGSDSTASTSNPLSESRRRRSIPGSGNGVKPSGGYAGKPVAHKYSAESNLILTDDAFTQGLATVASTPSSISTSTFSDSTKAMTPEASTHTSVITSTTSTSPEQEQQEDQAFNVIVNSTGQLIQSYVVSGLKHYYIYDVTVVACQNPVPPTPKNPGPTEAAKLCSDPSSSISQRTIQTLPRGEFLIHLCSHLS